MSCNNHIPHISQCKTCNTDCTGENNACAWNKQLSIQKKILKQTGQSASTYQQVKTSINVIGPLMGTKSNKLLEEYGGVNWNQASDRNVAGVEQRYVPRNRTRERPGAYGGGLMSIGVDVKHNSYARFLAKKKGKNYITKPNIFMDEDTYTPNLDSPIKGNTNIFGVNNCYYCT